jgi:hypothetical protein
MSDDDKDIIDKALAEVFADLEGWRPYRVLTLGSDLQSRSVVRFAISIEHAQRMTERLYPDEVVLEVCPMH